MTNISTPVWVPIGCWPVRHSSVSLTPLYRQASLHLTPPLAPPRSIRFAGPDAFYCHVNVRWVMTDFILFYFMLFLTVLIYSVVVNIESWGWVRWWEGLLVLRAGLLAGLTALWLEPRESLHQIERHPEQLEESQGWPTGLFSLPPHPPWKSGISIRSAVQWQVAFTPGSQTTKWMYHPMWSEECFRRVCCYASLSVI